LPNHLDNPKIGFSRAYLLYDSHCGPCTRFMKVVKLLDFQRKLTPVSIHGKQAEKLVSGKISEYRLKNSFHIVEVTNSGSEVFSAGDGIVRLTRYAPAGKIAFALVSKVKPFRQFLRWAYYEATRIRSASKTCSMGDKTTS
jgi:predicted DCC family thiol-disulfide oxidoreductase YuxK